MIATYLTGADLPLAQAFDAALLDLDGVVYRGPLPVEHAVEAIAAARAGGMRTVFVTNNANREPSTVADQLTSLGVPAGDSEVMTSAQAAAAMLKAELPAGSPVLAVGGPGLRTALTEAGLTVVSSADEAPVAVVQGFAPTVGWADLAEATYAIRAGARYVATNLDATIPTERGIAPGNGTLVGVVTAATGVVPASAGKPQPEIFRQAAHRIDSLRPLVVGDRLDTDLAGAVAAGMAGLHVLTGVSDARSAVLARPAERPRFISSDLRGLFEPHPEPRREPGGVWACAGASARILNGVIEISDGDGERRAIDATVSAEGGVALTLDALRALCCAAWEAADDGSPLTTLPRLRVVDGRADVAR